MTPSEPVEIRTERLRLRTPRPDDAATIATLINDIDVVRMLSRVPFPYALSDAEDFLATCAAADPGRERNLVIEHPDFGLIGGIGAHRAEDPWPEVGYWLGRTFWGRGFATEALRALTAWVDRVWASRALVSGHFADNPASGNVLVKGGFLHTGEVRQRFCRSRGGFTPTRMMLRLP